MSIARLSAFCGITILLLLVKTPNVFAQTTTITSVSYTRTALFDIDTQTPTPSLIVNATVGYGDAKDGDYLLVGVFDLDDGNPVSGLGSSIPLPCSSTVGVAGCLVPLAKQQGFERMSFSLDHPKGVWNLALIAALLDNAADPIANSYSDYTFTMTVQTALTFKVNVPVYVPVSVDGVNGSGGSVQLVLAAGNHTISVPQFVSVNNVTRLKFLIWSDGSTAANRTVELDHDITLNGNYVTQYYLHIISPVNVNGTGWYDGCDGHALNSIQHLFHGWDHGNPRGQMGFPELDAGPERAFVVIDCNLSNQFAAGRQCTVGTGLHGSLRDPRIRFSALRRDILFHENKGYSKVAPAIRFEAKSFEVTCTV